MQPITAIRKPGSRSFRVFSWPTRELVRSEAEFLPVKDDSAQVGPVKTFDNFILQIPPGVNPADYKAVVIWCESFGEFITAATYQ